MTTKLGTIELEDLRMIWPHEAHDFTPWLGTSENIGLLGDALGIELFVDEVEKSVGPYSADIVARDTDDAVVVIENQLEKTNHDHLGKCLTYAAVLNAKTVVWIASSFTDEHKKAFDWLNEKTGLDTSFFAVRLELWRIDGSNPALKFNVVSAPADIVKRAQSRRQTSELTDTQQLQIEWWTAVSQALAESGVVRQPRTPAPKYWYDVPIGRSGFNLSCTANIQDNVISVRQYLKARYNGSYALDQLLEMREEIENEVGAKLEWDPNPDARDKTIRLRRNANLEQRGQWKGHISWMVKTIDDFLKAFGPRIRELDLEVEPKDA